MNWFDWWIDWLMDWLIDWLGKWLIDWLIDYFPGDPAAAATAAADRFPAELLPCGGRRLHAGPLRGLHAAHQGTASNRRTRQSRRAETQEFWNLEFQQMFYSQTNFVIFTDNFHIIALRQPHHMTKIVGKFCIFLDFCNPAVRGFCKRGQQGGVDLLSAVN